MKEITQADIDLITSYGFSQEYDWVFLKNRNIYCFDNADIEDHKTFEEELDKYWVDCLMPDDLPYA